MKSLAERFRFAQVEVGNENIENRQVATKCAGREFLLN
jgi:hypothetical protein